MDTRTRTSPQRLISSRKKDKLRQRKSTLDIFRCFVLVPIAQVVLLSGFIYEFSIYCPLQVMHIEKINLMWTRSQSIKAVWALSSFHSYSTTELALIAIRFVQRKLCIRFIFFRILLQRSFAYWPWQNMLLVCANTHHSIFISTNNSTNGVPLFNRTAARFCHLTLRQLIYSQSSHQRSSQVVNGCPACNISTMYGSVVRSWHNNRSFTALVDASKTMRIF